ncbi:MAG: UDP-N-acetylglucosamine--N-acetylmuramyl-(pentapeptide) pyrophosphoryl-undecaprenol, partial [Bacteroidetes bacterium]|nr:UDP-N-acetylglucosamine--N-acetylmuramyl-(pentapeptide) pyrophosphoryl-undecaprenol [Bacteroidota bacterium]
EDKLVDIAIETIHQDNVLNDLSMNIKKLAFTNSASVIAEEVVKLANEYRKNHGN